MVLVLKVRAYYGRSRLAIWLVSRPFQKQGSWRALSDSYLQMDAASDQLCSHPSSPRIIVSKNSNYKADAEQVCSSGWSTHAIAKVRSGCTPPSEINPLVTNTQENTLRDQTQHSNDLGPTAVYQVGSIPVTDSQDIQSLDVQLLGPRQAQPSSPTLSSDCGSATRRDPALAIKKHLNSAACPSRVGRLSSVYSVRLSSCTYASGKCCYRIRR